MRVKAQVGMVMNLDKCIGCHTCSVTCKNVWTNRGGAEYMWFNNVETKPGIGYPKRWEDQDERHGGWELDKKGRLQLRSGSRAKRLANIFYNPDLPELDDYYEPFTYDYEQLTKQGPSEHQPVARPISAISGEPMDIEWGPNWEDDLAGAPATAPRDPNLVGIENAVKMEYERVFMMYLPRICEHCLNPSCVASCPSGAMYKRDEDGIVLVDQERCRGWRMCVSGCPYKKVYFNWQSGKAEKCTLCYPRIEAGMPTICSETCVGRIRYIGIVLYDADRVAEAAATPDPKRLLDAQLEVFLDPRDPEVIRNAEAEGIPTDWIDAAQRSPVWKLAMEHRVALPLHPEYRTLPMVWYVPPLSPVMGMIEGEGSPADPDDVFPAIDALRIPVRYLSNLLAAGDDDVIRGVLKKLAAMRSYMRTKSIDGGTNVPVARSVRMEPAAIEDLYRLLALAKYNDRFVIPSAHLEFAGALSQQGACGLEFSGGPGGCGVRHPTAPGDAAQSGESFHVGTAPNGGATGESGGSHADPDTAPAQVARDADGCGDGRCGCQDAVLPPALGGQPA
jgi:nitrate reductase / nitrite oxidoreductase, beta subunit